MSNARRGGIVDASCRTHDIINLYIAGSSVFATSGQANPTRPADRCLSPSAEKGTIQWPFPGLEQVNALS